MSIPWGGVTKGGPRFARDLLAICWLVPGGSIILDDYHDWGGCRKAVDQFLAEMGDQVTQDDSAGSLTLTRKPG
jgi:hypothetical protein